MFKTFVRIYLIHRSGGQLDQAIPNVVSINSKTVFSLAETNDLLFVVNKITLKYQERLNMTLTRIEQEGNHNTKAHLKMEAQTIIDEWNKKIKKLGAKPSGVWNADFDFGEGYYCWKFPEKTISHWHGYTEGFSNRKPVPTYLN